MAHASPLDLTGQVVLVTGGARGIGRTITTTFLEVGAEVVTCGRTEPPEPVRAGARTAGFVAADLREPDQAALAVSYTVDRHGRLDLVVNNAGGSPITDAATASPRFFASVVSLNLLAPYYVAQRANAVMQEQDSGGAIINIGSVSAVRPSPGTAAYGAAKAGLRNLTQTLAMEWAPKVRVNCVSAGPVADADADPEDARAAVAAAAATIPLGRLASPADVAGACLYLASPLASYVSGTDLVVHGGGEWPAFLAAVTGRT